ncbi:MAG: hypothetical protein H0X17_22595, partial [Deltaproteobacteria bacterium]|nr:hypothetical protein [Deltaproteobacteria bacterium]
MALGAFDDAVAACDPAGRVAAALAGLAGEIVAAHLRVGVAIGKAAVAM